MQYRKKTTPQGKNSKRWLWIIVGVAVIAALAVGGVLTWRHTQRNDTAQNDKSSRPRNSIDYSPSTEDENHASDPQKDGNKDGTTLDDSPLEPGTFTITVTGANASDSDKLLRVNTLVEGIDSGDCTLTLSQEGQSDITLINTVISQGNSFACGAFNVPYSSFPVGGKWNVKVAVVKDNKQATGSWEGGAVTITK
jgi:hypothetical protein